MANTVYYVTLGIELDLELDDLGHPNLPGLWDRIYPSKQLPPNQLQCLQCAEEIGPDCPEFMYLQQRGPRRVASHLNRNRKDHPAPESDLHKALKDRFVTAAQRGGLAAVAESPAKDRKRITDVLVTAPDGFKLGCEAQISYATADSIRKRTATAQRDGITSLWTTNSSRAQLIDRAPWARIDRMPWHEIGAADLPVQGGTRRLKVERCGARDGICLHKKRAERCTGWELHADPRKTYLDDLIVGAALRQQVPIHWPTGQGGNWFWVTAEDGRLFDDWHANTPTAASRPGPAAPKPATPKPAVRECQYGINNYDPEPSRPRDTGGAVAAIPAPRAERDSRRVASGICGYGVTPCGAVPARLYLFGWRCDAHGSRRAGA